MLFNVTLEISGTPTPESADRIVDQLSDFAAAVSTSEPGDMLVTITFEAPSVAAAAHLALGLAQDFKLGELRRLEVLSTAAFDRRLGLADLEDVVSVGEAAAELGVSTQAVRQRLEAGTLAGRKAGRSWHVSREAVVAAKARQQAGKRIRRAGSTSAAGGAA